MQVSLVPLSLGTEPNGPIGNYTTKQSSADCMGNNNYFDNPNYMYTLDLTFPYPK